MNPYNNFNCRPGYNDDDLSWGDEDRIWNDDDDLSWKGDDEEDPTSKILCTAQENAGKAHQKIRHLRHSLNGRGVEILCRKHDRQKDAALKSNRDVFEEWKKLEEQRESLNARRYEITDTLYGIEELIDSFISSLSPVGNWSEAIETYKYQDADNYQRFGIMLGTYRHILTNIEQGIQAEWTQIKENLDYYEPMVKNFERDASINFEYREKLMLRCKDYNWEEDQAEEKDFDHVGIAVNDPSGTSTKINQSSRGFNDGYQSNIYTRTPNQEIGMTMESNDNMQQQKNVQIFARQAPGTGDIPRPEVHLQIAGKKESLSNPVSSSRALVVKGQAPDIKLAALNESKGPGFWELPPSTSESDALSKPKRRQSRITRLLRIKK